MSAHLEFTHGVLRVFDDGQHFERADSFAAVMSVDRIGPDAVLLSADLSQRRLTRKDIRDIKQRLIEAGFAWVYCWRRIPRRVPYGGKVVRTVGNLALWEIEL